MEHVHQQDQPPLYWKTFHFSSSQLGANPHSHVFVVLFKSEQQPYTNQSSCRKGDDHVQYAGCAIVTGTDPGTTVGATMNDSLWTVITVVMGE